MPGPTVISGVNMGHDGVGIHGLERHPARDVYRERANRRTNRRPIDRGAVDPGDCCPTLTVGASLAIPCPCHTRTRAVPLGLSPSRVLATIRCMPCEPDLDSALRPVVVILLGVQGTGKTTLAEHAARWLHVPLFSKDELEATLMAVGYRPRWQLALGAYELLTRWLERSCGLGNPPSSTVWLHWSASAPLVRPRRGVRR